MAAFTGICGFLSQFHNYCGLVFLFMDGSDQIPDVPGALNQNHPAARGRTLPTKRQSLLHCVLCNGEEEHVSVSLSCPIVHKLFPNSIGFLR
jgi:hypothetical protein